MLDTIYVIYVCETLGNGKEGGTIVYKSEKQGFRAPVGNHLRRIIQLVHGVWTSNPRS